MPLMGGQPTDSRSPRAASSMITYWIEIIIQRITGRRAVYIHYLSSKRAYIRPAYLRGGTWIRTDAKVLPTGFDSRLVPRQNWPGIAINLSDRVPMVRFSPPVCLMPVIRQVYLLILPCDYATESRLLICR